MGLVNLGNEHQQQLLLLHFVRILISVDKQDT